MDGERPAKAPLSEIFTRDFLIIATINLAMFFGFQMTNVGIPVYMAQLGAEAQVVGLAATLMTITATIVRVFAGPILDRAGRQGLLVGGTFIMLCSIISYAVFPVVGIILGMRLIQGFGWGMGSTASSTIAADVIPKRRFAEGMGYFALTNALSSALAPAISVELAQGSGGAVMVVVAAAIVGIALVLALIEAALSKGKKQKAAEAAANGDAGPSGKPEAAGAPGAPRAAGAPAGPPAGLSTAGPGGTPLAAGAPASKLDVIFERRALIPSILILLVNVGFGCITTFIALHALDQGVDSVSPYFVVYAIVTLASRPYIGKLIDRYGYRMPAILSTLCTAGTLVVIGASTNIAMFACSGVLGGLGLGTAMSTYQAMAVASVEPWRRGVATSTYMTAFDLGIATGSFAGGFIAGAFGYAITYYAMAAFPLAACLLSFLMVKNAPRTAPAKRP